MSRLPAGAARAGDPKAGVHTPELDIPPCLLPVPTW